MLDVVEANELLPRLAQIAVTISNRVTDDSSVEETSIVQNVLDLMLITQVHSSLGALLILVQGNLLEILSDPSQFVNSLLDCPCQDIRGDSLIHLVTCCRDHFVFLQEVVWRGKRRLTKQLRYQKILLLTVWQTLY